MCLGRWERTCRERIPRVCPQLVTRERLDRRCTDTTAGWEKEVLAPVGSLGDHDIVIELNHREHSRIRGIRGIFLSIGLPRRLELLGR